MSKYGRGYVEFPPKLWIDDPSTGNLRQAYTRVTLLRNQRIHRGGSTGGGAGRLSFIVEEVKTRIGICKREIYFIGELLTEAKRIVGHGDFQRWIDDTFEFSYQTANNFMNVYKYCLGQPFIADTMKASVLYQISTSGFPKDLRAYLFEDESGRKWFENMKDADRKEMLRRYKAGELDLNDEGVKRYFNWNRRMVSMGDALDTVALCLKDLNRHKENINTVGGVLAPGYVNFSQDLQVAEQMNKAIDSIDRCMNELLEVHEAMKELVFEEPPEQLVQVDAAETLRAWRARATTTAAQVEAEQPEIAKLTTTHPPMPVGKKSKI
jgi:hypothetical protein